MVLFRSESISSFTVVLSSPALCPSALSSGTDELLGDERMTDEPRPDRVTHGKQAEQMEPKHPSHHELEVDGTSDNKGDDIDDETIGHKHIEPNKDTDATVADVEPVHLRSDERELNHDDGWIRVRGGSRKPT